MRRIVTTLATAAALGALVAASPAGAAAKKGPQLGDWTCADAAAAATSSLELFKGNKYAVDGGEKAKYVYKAGQDKVKFKSGDLAGTSYGTYDRETKTLSLHAMADDTVWATCAQVPVVEPAPEPEEPQEPEEPTP